MDFLNLGLRWLHVLSAITMVGGIFYVRFAVVPMLESLPEDQRESVGAALRRGWMKFVMISILLLLATGLTNMMLVPMHNDLPEGSNYGMLVGIKFLLALPVFYIVSLINGRSANAEKFRQKSRLWLNVAVVLCVAIVLLAGYLRFIPRTPKSADSPGTAAAEFHWPADAYLPARVF